jgi:catechol-2,3-dioxygenase
VAARDFTGLAQRVAQIRSWVWKARGEPLFVGVDHVGLYPHGSVPGADIAAWYENTFQFQSVDRTASFFLSGKGPGRIEVDKKAAAKPIHIAIRVSNFEDAVAALQAKGIALREPSIQPTSKMVYLKDPDPDGNLVHLLWTARETSTRRAGGLVFLSFSPTP